MQVERTQQTSAGAAGSLHARGSVRAPDRSWIRPWIKGLAEQVRRLAVVVMLGCAVLAPRAALAQSDAFSVEVAVSDRSPTERQDAYSQALRRVLVSNSGDKTIMNRDEIRRALSVAEDYVETYRFRTPEPGTRIPADTLVSDSVRETGEATDLLLVRFDRESVLALVAGGGNDQTSEGAEISVNPLDNIDRALVWLLIEDAERTVREAEPAASKVRERLREIAGGGGVELVFPDAGLGAGRGSDLGAGSNTGSDATANAATINELLSDEALRSQNIQAVRSASLRYATDVVLTGYLSRAVPPALDVNDARDAQALATPDSRGLARKAWCVLMVWARSRTTHSSAACWPACRASPIVGLENFLETRRFFLSCRVMLWEPCLPHWTGLAGCDVACCHLIRPRALSPGAPSWCTTSFVERPSLEHRSPER